MILLVSWEQRTGFRFGVMPWRHMYKYIFIQNSRKDTTIKRIALLGLRHCRLVHPTQLKCLVRPPKLPPHRPHPQPHLIQPLVQLLHTLPQPHLSSSRPRKTLLAPATRGDGPRLVPPRTRSLASRALITVQAGLRRPASGPRRSSHYSMGGRSPRSIEQWEMLARVK